MSVYFACTSFSLCYSVRVLFLNCHTVDQSTRNDEIIKYDGPSLSLYLLFLLLSLCSIHFFSSFFWSIRRHHREEKFASIDTVLLILSRSHYSAWVVLLLASCVMIERRRRKCWGMFVKRMREKYKEKRGEDIEKKTLGASAMSLYARRVARR